MSKEAVLAFRNKVLESAALQDQVRAAVKAGGSPAVVALGKTNGHEFTVDDLKQVYAPVQSGELSDAQLESVAGGADKLSPFELEMVSTGGLLGGGMLLGGGVPGSIGSALGGGTPRHK